MAGSVDIERLVVNMSDMGDIGFIRVPKDAQLANPDYPEEYFLRLQSGRLSPFYINGRDMNSFGPNEPLSIEEQLATRNLAVGALQQLIEVEPADHLMGVPQAMTPTASLVAGAMRASLLWQRAGTIMKQHGKGKIIQGHYVQGQTVDLIDNTITTAGSAIASADTLRDAGLRAVTLNVLIDREEEGQANLKAATPPITLRAAIGMRAVTAILLDNDRLSTREYEWLQGYYERHDFSPA